MKRILQITVGSMDHGGVQAFLMNIYRNIDTTQVQFDFIVHKKDNFFEKEILERGGRIFCIPSKKESIINNLISIYKLMKREKYEVVHRHGSSSVICLDLFIAKIAGANLCISHAHSSTCSYSLIHKLLRPFLNIVSDKKFACSENVGKWMYGKTENYKVIHNGIDVDRYVFDSSIRKKMRKELSYSDDEYVIGTVARLSPEKNQKFLLEIMRHIKKVNNQIKLLIVGDGPLKEELKLLVSNYGLENKVFFAGMKENVNQLLQAMDLFLLPSKYEGLPVTLVEAQTSGLKCLVSDKVTKEVGITDLVQWKSLDDKSEAWVKTILKEMKKDYKRLNTSPNIISHGYDIKSVARKLQNLYLDKL